MTTILGPKVTTPVFPGTQVAQGVDSARAVAYASYVSATPGWLTRVGVYARKANNTPKVTLAVYALDGSGNPSVLLGQTAKTTVPVSGGNVEVDLIAPVLLAGGQRFALASVVDGGTAEYPVAAMTTVWHRQMNSGVPANPFAATSIVTETGIPLYAIFSGNNQPTATLTAPALNATINTLTPTFTGAFGDVDSAAPTLDLMTQYRIQLRALGTSTLLWDGAYYASPSEQLAQAFSRPYGGSVLAAGGSYEWRAQVADESTTWSDWATWQTFFETAVGFVDLSTATSPAAKVDTDSSLIVWGGSWSHPSARSTQALQVQLLDADGNVLKTGPSFSQTVTNNNAFTVSAANAGIGAISGGAYQYQIKGQSTDGLWSAWSGARAFRVNSAPTIPSNLQPPSGASTTSYPLLQWNVDDPDPDDVYGVDDNSEIEFTRPNSTVETILTTNYDLSQRTGYYQLGAGDVTVVGTYKWRVRGNDLSAGSLGVGQWSPQQTFDFVVGPSVTITTPAANAVVTTGTPTVSWSAAGQTAYEVRLYRANQRSAIKDSGKQASVIQSFLIPPDWLQNGGVYDLDVTVWDASNNPGTSLRRRFTVTFTPPTTPQQPVLSLIYERRDYEPSSVLITWQPTDLPPNEFGGWLVWRRLASDDVDSGTLLVVIPTAGQTQYVDRVAPSNVPLIYGVGQLRRVSNTQVLPSAAGESSIEVSQRVATLTSMTDGLNHRMAVMWIDAGLKRGFSRPSASYVTWGSQAKDTLVSTPFAFGAETYDLSFTLRTDHDTNGILRGALNDHLNDAVEIAKSGEPYCLRTENNRIFVEILDWSAQRGQGNGTYDVTFSVKEIDYREGVSTEGLF